MPYNSDIVACLLLSACVYCFSSRITLEAAKLEEWKMNGKITYHQQVSNCGKQRCRKCREGIGHGPYWYAYSTENGRTTRTYIGKNLPPDLQVLLESPSPPDNLEPVALRIRTLGQFQLERQSNQEWQTVTDAVWQHQRVRALLACLLSNPGRKLGREQVWMRCGPMRILRQPRAV